MRAADIGGGLMEAQARDGWSQAAQGRRRPARHPGRPVPDEATSRSQGLVRKFAALYRRTRSSQSETDRALAEFAAFARVARVRSAYPEVLRV